MHRTIANYLPRVELDGLSVGHVGIRPKLILPGAGFRLGEFGDRLPEEVLGWRCRLAKSPVIAVLNTKSPGLALSAERWRGIREAGHHQEGSTAEEQCNGVIFLLEKIEQLCNNSGGSLLP